MEMASRGRDRAREHQTVFFHTGASSRMAWFEIPPFSRDDMVLAETAVKATRQGITPSVLSAHLPATTL